MGRWTNEATGARVSVADEKDSRFGSGWRSADAPVDVADEVAAPKRGPGRPKKSD